MQTMIMTLYMQNLRRDQLANQSLQTIAGLSTTLGRIETLCRTAWEPSDAQVVCCSIYILVHN